MATNGTQPYGSPEATNTPEDGKTEAEQTKSFDERMKSFDDWPLNDVISKEKLARVGLVYTGNGTLVKCCFCGIQYRDWQEGDIPLSVHQRCNPRCPFLQTLTSKPKQKREQKSHSQVLDPHNHNNHSTVHSGKTGRRKSRAKNSSADPRKKKADRNSSSLPFICEPTNQLGISALGSRSQTWQQQVNVTIEAEIKEFSSNKNPTQSLQPQDHDFTMLHSLPNNSTVMTFVDNTPPHYIPPEQLESENRGVIDPFKIDSDVEMDETQEVTTEEPVECPTVMPVHMAPDKITKPLHDLKLYNDESLCALDLLLGYISSFSDENNECMIDLKNSSGVPSSVSSSSDDIDEGENTNKAVKV